VSDDSQNIYVKFEVRMVVTTRPSRLDGVWSL